MVVLRLIVSVIIMLFVLMFTIGIVFSYKNEYRKKGKKNKLICFIVTVFILSGVGYVAYPYKKSDNEKRLEKRNAKIEIIKDKVEKHIEKLEYEQAVNIYNKLDKQSKNETRKLLEDSLLEVKNKYINKEISIEMAKKRIENLGKAKGLEEDSQAVIRAIDEREWRQNKVSQNLKTGIQLENEKRFKDAIESYEKIEEDSIDYDHGKKRLENLKKNNKTKNYIELKNNIDKDIVAYIEKNYGMVAIFKIIDIKVDDTGNVKEMLVENMEDGSSVTKSIKDIERGGSYGLVYYREE